MIKKILYSSLSIIALSLSSCIKNDIPYPHIQVDFLTFEVENQIGTANIDNEKRTVQLQLNEEANIADVKVKGYTLTEGGHLADADTITSLNLSKPAYVTLELYQEYLWVVSATQNIERYCVVQGQIGTTVIDAGNRRAIFVVPDNVDLSKIYIESIKLGQANSVMTPDLNGKYVDFSTSVSVDVTTFGVTETWHLYADVTKATVFTNRVDAWTNVAWAYGEAEVGKNNGFEYRQANSSQWITVPQDWITFNGGSMTARIIHLQPETEYVVRAYSDEMYGAELTFTTENVAQMPNSSFDDWSQSGKIWQPWGEGQQQYWDTGNKGATILGTANVMPTDDTSTGKGRAALLKTEFKGIGSLGKLAAGSIYAGYFVRTDGTNGVLSFGRPFSQHPTGLRGAFKYKTAPISDVTTGFEELKGRPDTCIVWVALIDSEEPFEIRTNPKNRHLFNPNGSEVIAYGQFQVGYDVKEYTEFQFNLNYVSTSRVPNYILCVSSSSKLGDYFTGGQGAELYLDDLELLYDY